MRIFALVNRAVVLVPSVIVEDLLFGFALSQQRQMRIFDRDVPDSPLLATLPTNYERYAPLASTTLLRCHERRRRSPPGRRPKQRRWSRIFYGRRPFPSPNRPVCPSVYWHLKLLEVRPIMIRLLLSSTMMTVVSSSPTSRRASAVDATDDAASWKR
jgi:hypothetical protein